MTSTNPTSDSSGESYRVICQVHVCDNDIGNLFNNDLFCDMLLFVQGKIFRVHKSILAIRSGYFRTTLSDTSVGLSLNEPNAELFEKLLRYIYLGEMHIREPFVDEAVEMLRLANQYLVSDLQKSLAQELKSALLPSNFCTIYSAALSCSAFPLVEKCLVLADEKPIEILQVGGFSKLDTTAIKNIIGRDSFKTCQVEVFTAVSNWIEANGKLNMDCLLSMIQLEEMPIDVLETTVRPSGLFTANRILDAVFAIHKKATSTQSDGTAPANTEDGSKVWIKIHDTRGLLQAPKLLTDVHAFHTIGHVRQEIKRQFPRCRPASSGVLWNAPVIPISGGSRSQSFEPPAVCIKLLDEAKSLESYGVTRDNNGHILLTMWIQ